MFFFKKIFSRFFFPVPLTLIIFISTFLFLISNRKKKWAILLLSIGIGFYTAVSLPFLPDLLLSNLESSYKSHCINSNSSISKDIKYVVILGGGHTFDQNLPLTSQLSRASIIRLMEGIRIYKKFSGIRMVLSGGGKGIDDTDAFLMAELAKELDVKPRDIIMETKSRDTKDQVIYLKKIIKDSPFFLVTSASHMKRAMCMFLKEGMKPLPIPTDHQVKISKYRKAIYEYFPRAENLYKMERAIYEYLGLIWAYIRGQI